MSRLMLGRQLASEEQMGETGLAIIGAGTNRSLDSSVRLATQYGGDAADWAKMSSSSYQGIDGYRFETHWYENVRTGLIVEFKSKPAGLSPFVDFVP